ncbi:glucuronate isomerase [Staphylococcus edaphicus]|uniref:Uronate isomerase n=1 Tax=Staphylococcus edaphicus TaxID=1955013 RepID=A0A2C6VF74_9STAP|nr:glucuronate isomerase [Staphylococcus edaphicus]PHK48961.1 glucuronate isomerase [Staphylococcus edaphicus]UQW81952.1 glucuronate isomerase [Staphylococcus edaphicus]
MTLFINDKFMLQNDKAIELYNQFAKDMPIYDYHCHLDPQQISENKHFNNITELWLGGDHYKWRAMRAQGIEEYYITGDAPPREKFKKWAFTLENAVANPLYHWSHLELSMYFDVHELLTEENADRIYDEINSYLTEHHVTTQSLISQSNVNLICTTDDPTDDLHYHDEIKAQKDFKTTVLPAFRPDIAFKVNEPCFAEFIDNLSKLTQPIHNVQDFISSMKQRVEYFHEKGGRLADHGLATIDYQNYTQDDIDMIFEKAIAQQPISTRGQAQFQTFLLKELSRLYTEKDWVMQIHFGAIRNNNTKAFSELGADTGFDSIRDQHDLALNLNRLLDMMAKAQHLPSTILYNLNPIYNDIVGSTIANFQNNSAIQSKVQHGAGWWFNDTKRGMLKQMSSLADQGLIMHFVGMLTDSRSFISYSRHDYFRRILCTFIGELVEKNEIPDSAALLEKLITNICYNNAYNYFKLI